MARLLPRRRGTSRPAAAVPFFASLAFAAPLFAQTTPAQTPTPAAQTPMPAVPAPLTQMPPPGTQAPLPAVPAPAVAPTVAAPTVLDTAPTPARSTALAASVASPGSAHNLLTRLALDPMGKNNGVRLWVHGDGSNATLRVRLSVQGANDPADGAPLRPAWVCAPITLSFTGWHEVLLPRAKFNLHSLPASAMAINTALPADAQALVSPAQDTPAPKWAKINTLTVETRVPRRAAILLDDVSWVTLDGAGAVTDETSVDDFEKGNVAAWTPGGPLAEQNSLVYGLASQPGQAHGGRVAFKLDITSPAAARQTTLTAFKRSLVTTGKAYAVFSPASLFDPILPTSLPPKGLSSSAITLRVCPDQIQAASFCLYSAKGLTNVSVAPAGDLQAAGHVFSRGNIDVRVVKVWEQGGAGPLQDPDTASLVPELLVKDDRVPLSGAAPAARLTGAPVTDIPADTTKQFWVTVTVPRVTFPTRYTGSLKVTGTGLAPSVTVPIDITVMPLRLLSPAKQYAINLRSRLDNAPAALPSDDGRDLATDFVTKDQLDKQLADIAAHGVRIPTLYDSPATLAQAVGEYRQYGMGEPYVYRGTGDPSAIETARKQTPAGPFFFYDDDSPLSATGPRYAALLGSKLLPATFITVQQDYDAVGSGLGLAIYNRDSAYAQKLVQTKGLRVSSTRDWWYWPASDENPLQNRLDSGYLLWRANLYGAFLPAYQAPFGTDPYDETSQGAPAFLAAYRPQMLTYPAQDGVIDTLQWEAVREGITDVRYLTTLYTALRECKDAHIQKPLVTEAEAYAKTFLGNPLVGLPEGALDTARTRIAAYALQLRTAVDAYNKTSRNGQ